MMLLAERRKQYRRVLEGTVCIHPASVFDAMSARMAQSLGFEVGMFSGSIAAGTVLGAPDLVVLTLTEFAEQIRRITRGSDLPLMVDADHGYGNALNVMRTVEELETSGVAALTIEDTVLPTPFGRRGDGLVSVEEMLGKLRGAVAARQDPALVVIGRTGALRHGGVAEAEKRVKAYQETGIDAIFLAGASSREEGQARWREHRLPEDDARRATRLDDLAGRRECAAAPVDAERHDRVAVHVRSVEHRARRLDGEKSRRLALRGLPADGTQCASRVVDREDDEAVV